MKDPLQKVVEQLDEAFELAKYLFQDDTKATAWLDEPNDLFFGWSPAEMIVGGKGDSVLETLKEWAGVSQP